MTWPSDSLPELLTSPAYVRALAVAREILGDDLAFDLDMLIDKAPGTATPTPWHQDIAYWIDLPDRRAASCWIALDDATGESGCMWFVPGSHRLPMRPHRPAGTGGGALECDGSEAVRPQAMVELARARGFDHGKDAPGRENRNPLTRS